MTIKHLLAACGVLMVAQAYSQENIYRNLTTLGYVPSTAFFTNNEVGDEVTFGGTNRNLTYITFAYVADLTTVQFDERVRVRVRNVSGGIPTNVVWQSGLMDIRPGFHGLTVAVPNVTVPNQVAITVQFVGMSGAAGDRAGIMRWNSPTIGTSPTTYLEFIGGVWTQLGAPLGNLGISVWANGTPTLHDTYANQTSYYYPSPNQYGESVYVEGTSRRITQFEAQYYGDFTVPQGDETMNIRFYKQDPVTYKPSGAAFYLVNVPLTAGDNTASVNPNITVPPDFIYTVGFNNMTYNAGDRAGLRTADPATSGWSGDYFVEYDGAPDWGFFNFSPAPIANFKVRVTGAEPVDLTMTSVVLGPGFVVSGSVADLATSNNVRLVGRPGAIAIATLPNLVFTMSTTSPVLTADEMRIVIEGQASVNSIIDQRILLFVPTLGTYVELDGRIISTTDQTVEVSVSNNVARYINQSTGEIRIRVTHKNQGPVAIFPWNGRLDYVVVRLYP